MRRLLFLVFLASCSRPVKDGAPPFQDRLLATIPPGVDVFVPVAFSPNGLEAAYVAQTEEGCWAVRGSWKSRRLDAM
jgi:hypothetical protein